MVALIAAPAMSDGRASARNALGDRISANVLLCRYRRVGGRAADGTPWQPLIISHIGPKLVFLSFQFGAPNAEY
jgi:hypothetical protein